MGINLRQVAEKNAIKAKKEEISRSNSSRAAVRIVISMAVGISVGVTPFVTPFLTYLSISDIASSSGFSLWINAAIVYSALLGTVMVRMLNYHSRLYTPLLAKMVFGTYRKELDQMGDDLDVDFFMSSKVIFVALAARFAIDKGIPVTWNGHSVGEILPLNVDNAALPNRGVVFMRLDDSILLCGPNYFLENLTYLQVNKRPIADWIQPQELLIYEYVSLICRSIYCGLPLDMETIMSIGEKKWHSLK